VPEGKIALPGLYDEDDDVGYITTHNGGDECAIVAYVRKAHQPVVQNLIDLTRKYVKEGSIYKGKVITSDMKFVHIAEFDMGSLVLKEDTRYNLEHHVMQHILTPGRADRLGAEPRRAALFYGPYGTGKSMALREIAKRASEAGWTVFVNKDTDNMADVLRMARMYQPSVVQIEDVDARIGGARDGNMNTVLNVMDGALGKNDRVMTIMTTNNPQRIHEAALRPGRISVAIHFGGLDGQGFKRIIEQCGLPMEIDDDAWDGIAEKYNELMPAYVKEAANRVGFSVDEDGGVVRYDDVVNNLELLVDHLRLQQKATSTNDTPTLEDMFRDMVKAEVQKAFNTWMRKNW
jgi:SpoVK/Ycf46/Vps4 family AAA+-type ATPase